MSLRLHSFPTRRSSDLRVEVVDFLDAVAFHIGPLLRWFYQVQLRMAPWSYELSYKMARSEEHTSELQSHSDLVCRLLLEKKNSICLFMALSSIMVICMF